MSRRVTIGGLLLAGFLSTSSVAATAAQSLSPSSSPDQSPAAATACPEASAAASSAGTATPGADDSPVPAAVASPEVVAASPPAPSATSEGCPSGDAIVLTTATTAAQMLAFTETTLAAPAATVVTVEYLNDSPLEHNIAFYEGVDADAPLIAQTEEAAGPDDLQTTTFITPVQPGSYFFQCDLHPLQMVGTLEIS